MFYKTFILLSLLPIFAWSNIQADQNQDYEKYHREVIKAEVFITSENYTGALLIYEGLFKNYDFIFLREYQIATQLALHLKDEQKARQYLKQGILAGWKIKSIRSNSFLSKFRDDKEWKAIKKDYKILRPQYESSYDNNLRKQVKKMFSRDQWKAIRALFTFSSDAQDRYAEKKFAPHSEQQIAELLKILEEYGYPGEKLIGNNFWMSTILSHHNSISQEYAEKDTLYLNLKPKLKQALKEGQMSPFEYALIDEWYRSTTSNGFESGGYGFLDPPSPSELSKFNALRQIIYLRPIEVRNKLVDIQEKTGMNFYLPGNPWVKGRIKIKPAKRSSSDTTHTKRPTEQPSNKKPLQQR